MTKKFLLTIAVLVIIILCFAVGLVFDKKINSAALSSVWQTHAQCSDQKCIVASGLGINQCSKDSDCVTHTQCNNSEQCVPVMGAGINKCTTAKDCLIKDPQQWCKANNTTAGINVKAVVYSNGKFTCECYYVASDGTHPEAPCTNSHRD